MKLNQPLDEKAALNKLAAMCSKEEKCIYDVRKKLVLWGLAEVEQARIISWLQEHSFVDQSRYALGYARDKHRFNKWGRQKIMYMLRGKGIEEVIIRKALEEIPHESYSQNLLELLIKKRKQIKDENIFQIKAKLYTFAVSKGFESDEVMLAMEKVLQIK